MPKVKSAALMVEVKEAIKGHLYQKEKYLSNLELFTWCLWLLLVNSPSESLQTLKANRLAQKLGWREMCPEAKAQKEILFSSCLKLHVMDWIKILPSPPVEAYFWALGH